MRFNNKHDLKNYLGNRRIAVIQKANYTTHTLIQFVNNRLIDKKILEWNNEHSTDIRDPFKLENIASEIAGYNILATTNDLQRILKHSTVTRDIFTENEARKIIQSTAGDLTQIEAKRIVNNLDYIGDVLTNADVDIKKYEALIEKLPNRTSRSEILNRCTNPEEHELVPTQRQRWLEKNLERGASYNKRYTYKELNQLSRDLERYKTHRLDYEKSILENKQAFREGYDAINQTKSWIWSTLEKTRHQEMDGETVPLTSKFEVTNEQTGDVDYLLFPGDVSNDHNNCSNICNCGCTYEINN